MGLELLRAQMSSLVHDDAELNARQLLALLTVAAAGGPLTFGELRTLAALSGPTLTRAVDRLETLGLVERKPNADDRRSVFVSMTKRGRIFVGAIEQVRQPEHFASGTEIRAALDLIARGGGGDAKVFAQQVLGWNVRPELAEREAATDA